MAMEPRDLGKQCITWYGASRWWKETEILRLKWVEYPDRDVGTTAGCTGNWQSQEGG